MKILEQVKTILLSILLVLISRIGFDLCEF